MEVVQRARVILYVDGNSDDAFFFGRSLKQVLPEAEWRHVATVHEAKCYLKGKGSYQDRRRYPFPQMVLADSKLPDGTAADFHSWIRSQSELASLRVCVFADPGYDAASHGSCVFDKPGQLREWPQVISQMIEWLHGDKS